METELQKIFYEILENPEDELELLKDAQSKLAHFVTILDGNVSKQIEQKFDEVNKRIDKIKLLKGEKGDDYVLTRDDKKEIAAGIKVPIVEKVIERIEVIKEQPIVTEIVKEKAVTETADVTVEKINKLPTDESQYLFAIRRIEGLEELLKDLKQRIGQPRFGGGGVSRTVVEELIAAAGVGTPVDPTSGDIDGSNTQFVFTTKPTLVVNDAVTLRENKGWTWDSGTSTVTTDNPPTFDLYAL